MPIVDVLISIITLALILFLISVVVLFVLFLLVYTNSQAKRKKEKYHEWMLRKHLHDTIQRRFDETFTDIASEQDKKAKADEIIDSKSKSKSKDKKETGTKQDTEQLEETKEDANQQSDKSDFNKSIIFIGDKNEPPKKIDKKSS